MMEIKAAEIGRGGAWLIEAFEYFRGNAGPWIGVCIIALVITIASGVIPFAGLVLQLLTPVFLGGLILGCRDIANGEPLKVNHLFAGFTRYTGNLVLVGVIYALGFVLILLVMLAIMFVTLGGMHFINAMMDGTTNLMAAQILNLLLVALIGMALYLPLLMSFWFAPALIVLDDQAPVESMKLSFIACLKNILPLLIYGLLGLVFAVLASIPMLLGWFILSPMMIASIYISYGDIFVSDKPVTIVQE